jgi:hypothetical protein
MTLTTSMPREPKISKGPKVSNPVEPNSDATGNTIFVLRGLRITGWRGRALEASGGELAGSPRLHGLGLGLPDAG